jgi:hypothetical protein
MKIRAIGHYLHFDGKEVVVFGTGFFLGSQIVPIQK